MAGEGEDEAAVIERQLDQQLQEQRSSLAAVDEALAADPSNADLLEVRRRMISFPSTPDVPFPVRPRIADTREPESTPRVWDWDSRALLPESWFRDDEAAAFMVHEELLAAIKDAEEGLLHLKRSRLMKQLDDIFPNQEAAPQSPEVAVEPIDPNDVEPEQLEPQDFSVGSKCRFRHKDGRWYNGCIVGFEDGSKSLVGSSILAALGHDSGLWRRAELESWDDDLKLGKVIFRDDGSSARLPGDFLSISEYADMSDEDDEGSSSEEKSEFSDDGDKEDDSVHQGLGLSESTNFSGIQTDTVIFAKWEHHTRGVASKMMAKMGYREGMGLGVSGQGMLDPIPVKVLPPKQSLDHAVAKNEDERGIGSGKKRSRGGKRKREKKFAEEARAAKAEEAERSVFSFINNHLVSQDAYERSATKNRKGPSGEASGHAKKEDRRSLVVYDEEVKELRIRVEKLEEMKNRNRKDKAVYEAASRKLEDTRTALAEAEVTHASAINAVSRKEKEKKWLKF
ncbi:hypothetical protein PR202_ga03152 [Eleusine coracana subsp. coracana]|uniref:G-patch domain-containing protein n=1 Tax=Eleusine coracana subsp. coracana TaxID=191504 RepID=A0AAV5BNJ0_ELECO|nr:hypothetical protein PR202_ga03152 [Eleusine coracana subsp. coracana]